MLLEDTGKDDPNEDECGRLRCEMVRFEIVMLRIVFDDDDGNLDWTCAVCV